MQFNPSANPENWKREIEEIKKEVVKKEQISKEKGESFDRKEIVKETISQKVSPILQSQKPATTQTKSSPTQEEAQVLERIIRLAKTEGIVEGYKASLKTKNPWLIDAFHDRIVEEILKEL